MDFVELGIRTTADGKLVLMHDRTVDRMTDGKGLVKDKTLAKIKALDLGVRFPGQFPNLRVPTFDEALAAAHGRIGIYIDAKDATPQDLIAAIERHDMGSHVLFWSEHPDFMSQIQQLRPEWTLMPEAFNPENVQKIVEVLHPRVLGFDQRDFNDATIGAARNAKVGIFVDRQTPENGEMPSIAVRQDTDEPPLRTYLWFAKNSISLKGIDYSAGSSTLQPMIETLRWLGILMRAALRERRDLALENLALRQQLGVLKRRKRVPQTEEGRPIVLGRAFPNLGPLAIGLAPGERGYGRRLAAKGLPNLLDQDFAAGKSRSTTTQFRSPSPDQADGDREPVLGRPSHSRGTAQAGNGGFRAHGLPTAAQAPEATFQTWKAFLNNHVQGLARLTSSRYPP